MRPFEGFATFDTDGEPLFYRLVKGLYGLVQAALLFNNELVSHFLSDDFIQCQKDPCTFVKIKGDVHIMVPVHVDDLLPTGKPYSALIDFQDNLEKSFEIKRLGTAKWFSGMAITKSHDRTHISQTAAITDFVKHWAVEGHPDRRTPMDAGVDLYAMTYDTTYPGYDSNLADGTDVRSYSGGYAWIGDSTRPDLAFFRMSFARQQQQCSVAAFEIMKQSVYHLNATKHLGIEYLKDTAYPNQPITVVDAGFLTCKVTRKSCFMLLMFINGGPIYWKGKMAPGKTPAGNTMEAEIVPLFMAWKFNKFMYAYLCEIGFPPKLPLLIYGDNNSAILFARNARITQENRHMDVKYCILASEYNRGFVDFKHIKTQSNIADIGTKAQNSPSHFEFLAKQCTAPRDVKTSV